MKKIALSCLISTTVVFNNYSQQFSMVADLNVGSGSSEPKNISHLNHTLLFTAYSTTHGYCLFKSDGTNQGTTVVQNQINSNEGIYWYDFQNYKLFQKATDKATKIWITDGSNNGTYPAFNLSNVSGNAIIKSSLCVHQGHIYLVTEEVDVVWGNVIHKFCRIDSNFQNFEILHTWQNAFSANYINFQIEVLSGNIFIGDYGSTGLGTWKYDLTTNSMFQISSGPTFFNSVSKVQFNNKLYYSIGGNLYSLDGVNGQISTVLTGLSVGQLIVYNNQIYLSAGTVGPGLQGVELYKTDGTASNTSIVADVYFGYNSSFPQNFNIVNNKLFFEANTINGCRGVFCFNSSTNQLSSVYTSNYLFDQYAEIPAVGFNNKLYFFAPNNSNNSWKLWESSGGSASLTSNINSTSDSACIRDFHIAGNELFFVACDDQSGAELWSSQTNNLLIDELAISGIYIYPNPTFDVVSVSIPDELVGSLFNLCDQFGKIILSGKFLETKNTLDLTSLTSGLYFLSVDGRNIVKLQKQ